MQSAHGWVSRRLGPGLGLIALWSVVGLIVMAQEPVPVRDMVAGEVAPRTVYATRDFLDESVSPPRLIKRGQLLIQQGVVVSGEHLSLLSSLRGARSTPRHVAYAIGTGLILALLLTLGWLLLVTLSPMIARRPSLLWLVAAVFIGTLILTKLMLWVPLPRMAAPLSMASMLIALLVDIPSAVIMTLVLAPLISLLFAGHVALPAILCAAAVAGLLAVRRARRRSQLLRAGLWVGLIHCLGLASYALWSGLPLLQHDLWWGIANGLASSLIVMGLLPLFEHAFQLTTDIRLLELADLNHPVLKELVLKAPGTYHHSLIVGNLAEAACEAIGANALLARVGSYFHDIGKMEQADYFIENQAGGDYLHDKLTPAMSGLIITNHVRRGVALAKKSGLPRQIVDFIPQHHGTGLVFYFYHKALETYDEAELAEHDFRYEGPKPQSKETAVALLADGIEASCRALVDPTPARIRGLVRKIINARFIDGQLDECDLTLRDLTKIEAVFTRVLLGIHHTRIQYPDTENDDPTTCVRPAGGRPSAKPSAHG